MRPRSNFFHLLVPEVEGLNFQYAVSYIKQSLGAIKILLSFSAAFKKMKEAVRNVIMN